MLIDPQYLRQHYASLSDDELVALNRDDLTEVAQKCYDWEIRRRDLSAKTDEELTFQAETEYGSDENVDDGSDGMFVASSFMDDHTGSAAADAEDARRALGAAGIPCQIEVREIPAQTSHSPSAVEHQLLVPMEWSLQATSVLDRDVFNSKIEADWKTHLESLSDNQLLAMNADDICAGFLDRAERLRKAYEDEIRRRQL